MSLSAEAGSPGTSAGRVALVTGSSGGIGRAVAERFAREGWRVLGVDVRPDRRDDSALDRFAEVDLSSPPAIEALFARLAEREGRLDVLVNNAAVQVCRPIDDLTLQDWDRVLSVNLRAPFLCARAALPFLRSTRGSIVNVSSVHARHTSPQMAAYAASKGGLDALTRALAVELASDGVRVNAVLPGAVDTEMLRRGLERGHLAGGESEDAVERFARAQMMERVARPEEVADAVLYLADPDRSSYVTGASLLVDGGVSARLSSE